MNTVELREIQTRTDDILRIINETNENNFNVDFARNLRTETGITTIKKEWKEVIILGLQSDLEKGEITQSKFDIASQLLDLNNNQDTILAVGGRKSRRNKRRKRRSRRYK